MAIGGSWSKNKEEIVFIMKEGVTRWLHKLGYNFVYKKHNIFRTTSASLGHRTEMN
jgi:hypothetical protein